VKPRPHRSTVPAERPAPTAVRPYPPHVERAKVVRPKPPKQRLPKREVARILDQSETSLVDVLDNLLNRGVVLNAEIILALADVDLVYIRLSALLCAADRILSGDDR
jgi:hypothetical protein